MIYAKKSRLGLYSETDVSESTFVILTNKEYQDIEKEVRSAKEKYFEAETQLRKSEKNYYSQLDRLKRSQDDQKRDDRRNHYQEIAALEQKHRNEMKAKDEELRETQIRYEMQKREADAFKEFNVALKRITTERANTDRNIPGRKGHHGYLVLSSGQVWGKVPAPGTPSYAPDYIDAMLWKTILQTPYDATISYNAVKTEVLADMEKIKMEIGIDEIKENDNSKTSVFGGIFDTLEEDTQGNIVTVYRMLMRADTRAGYWTVELTLNLPITIPSEMIPPKKDNTRDTIIAKKEEAPLAQKKQPVKSKKKAKTDNPRDIANMIDLTEAVESTATDLEDSLDTK